MPYHHLALATHDMKAIDLFYTKAMGFELVKCERASTPAGGWAKHFFYETGKGELMAFWELHDETLPSDFPVSISAAAGLPEWTNHLAFAADDMNDLEARKKRWLEHGYDVLEIDHHWCYSIYTKDPNDMLVEFCVTTAEFGVDDAEKARYALTNDDLEPAKAPIIKVHKTESQPVHLAA